MVWLLAEVSDAKFNSMSALFKYDVIFTAIVLKLVVAMLISYRWMMVLRYNNIHQYYSDSLKFILIGHSLMTVIPGVIGQDVVKVAGTIGTSVSSSQNMKIVSLAILDRLIGLLSLIISSAVFISVYLIFYGSVSDESLLHKLLIMFLMFSFIIIIMFVLLYFSSKRIRNIVFSSRSLNIFFSKVLKIIDHLDALDKKPMLVYISIISHIINSLILILIVKEIYNEIDVLINIIFGLISNFGNLFPFTPGGLGVTESVFMYLYSFIGYDNGVIIGGSYRLLSYASIFVLTIVFVIFSYLSKYKYKKIFGL